MAATAAASLVHYVLSDKYAFEDLGIYINDKNSVQSKISILVPSEDTVNQEWIDVSGEVNPSNFVVFLINELNGNDLWLQRGFTIPNSEGKWTHKCNIRAFNVDRNVYAIGLQRKDINIFEQFFTDFTTGKRELHNTNMNEVTKKLDPILKYVISKPKSISRN